MKVKFALKSAKEVVEAITSAMGGRKLAEVVSLAAKGDDIIVTFSKLGTSTIEFTGQKTQDGLVLEVTREKIAFTHRAFKDEVTEKLKEAIEKAGGKIQA